MKYIRKIIDLATDTSRDFKERIFIVLTMAAVGVAAIALLGDILYRDNIVEIIILIGTVIGTPLTTIYAVKKDKISFVSKIISMAIIYIIMPGIFIFGGGPEGGALPWLIFSYLYIGLVMSGPWRLASLILHTVNIAILYSIAYYYPDLIYTHSRELFYTDSALAVIEVGFVCFIMAWFQGLMFAYENRRAKDEAKKYEELNKSQNRFFSSMSHEIRTPINSILGLNEIILRQDDASDEILRDAGNIQGAGRMLLALVNDILDISKIEAGKLDIIPVNYKIASMISEIVNMMWLRAEQKGLMLKIEIDPTIPSELYGDEVRIKQILVNLLNNAVKYTKEGTITLHIEVEDAQNDKVLLSFSVTDTGMGIKQDALPDLFDAFQRVEEEKNRNIEGTGLGLSIVKQLVDLMDGEISVNSVYTQGSTFVVNLWQSVTNSEAVGEINISSFGSSRSENRYEAGFKAPYVSILIVDDNEMNLEVEKKLLQGTEMQIDTVSSGVEALSHTLTNRYDMIFMDHLMPEMDGIECLQRIRRQPGGLNNHVPIIALTANAGSENIDLYNRSGFDGYLVKPVSGHQLEEMLLKYLPESKVTRTMGSDFERAHFNTARGYSKKIPIQIATSTLCDLPMSVIKDCQIDTIPFHICTDEVEYYDGIETTSYELLMYIKEGIEFYSKPPTIEEFEAFFGAELKKAHQVVYIAVSSLISKEYEIAKEAARAYGNVYVYNSGTNSAAMGLQVMCAYKMLSSSMTPGKIIEELSRIKDRINCSYVVDDLEYMFSIKMYGKWAYRMMETMGVRPIVRIKNGTYGMDALCIGDMRNRYDRFIDIALPRRVNPDLDVVIIVYADMTSEDLKWIESRIRKKYDFKHIVFQKSSSVIVLKCGGGAFGIIYMRKGSGTYALGNLFDSLNESQDEGRYLYRYDDEDENEDYDSNATVDSDSEQSNDEIVEEPKWYEGIEGIDPETALENCGSEDSLLTVMKIFYDSIDQKAGELCGFYEKEDWENYTIKVHALKSSAKIIGANKLSDDAKNLEYAGKDNDIEFIKANHDDLMEEFKAYKPILDEVFGVDEKEESAVEDKEPDVTEHIESDFENNLMESVYEALREGAETKDNDMIEATFEEIEEYGIPESHKDVLEKLKSCYNQSDYDEMIKIIDDRG